jgi:formamidopyrimidine-DNA glycosylase
VPEGHTLHRLAREHTRLLVGQRIGAGSPQGRFAAGAARLDGAVVQRVGAVGKHLFYAVDAMDEQLHIHLGLYGTFLSGNPPAPDPKGALRLRITTDAAWIDLRGPTACELLTPDAVSSVIARLGPDPLSRGADPDRAWQRLRRSRVALGAALMDQRVVAGIGNVYRAELLFRHRRDPYAESCRLDEQTWAAMWDDIVGLMRAGVRTGRIVTTLPEHRDRRSGTVRRADAHYVYRRQGLPCRVCGTPIRWAEMVGRRLYWCPVCQIE